jgi:hypothetical protein
MGNYYAIVIGINSYPPPLPVLVTAVDDAKAIASLLSANYGFHITLLLDKEATRVNIIDAINGFRDTLNENDSLLIYYAGHDFSDHLTDNKADDKAYWLPVDANSRYSSNRIIADELTASIKAQSARHVLIISDSCFSGGLARGGDIPIESAGRTVFLNRMSRSRSRTLMASGGGERRGRTGVRWRQRRTFCLCVRGPPSARAVDATNFQGERCSGRPQAPRSISINNFPDTQPASHCG